MPRTRARTPTHPTLILFAYPPPFCSAWTTFWNIRSASGAHAPPQHNNGAPGACTYGPDLTLVGLAFHNGTSAATAAGWQSGGALTSWRLCPAWFWQPGEVSPSNLFRAQLARRKALLQEQQELALERAAFELRQTHPATVSAADAAEAQGADALA